MARWRWVAAWVLSCGLAGCFGARGTFHAERAEGAEIVLDPVRFYAGDVPALSVVQPLRMGVIHTWPRPRVRFRGVRQRQQERRAGKIARRVGGTHFALMGAPTTVPGMQYAPPPPWSGFLTTAGTPVDDREGWWLVVYVPEERWPYLPTHLQPVR